MTSSESQEMDKRTTDEQEKYGVDANMLQESLQKISYVYLKY